MVLESNYSLENFDPEVLREYDIRGIVLPQQKYGRCPDGETLQGNPKNHRPHA